MYRYNLSFPVFRDVFFQYTINQVHNIFMPPCQILMIALSIHVTVLKRVKVVKSEFKRFVYFDLFPAFSITQVDRSLSPPPSHTHTHTYTHTFHTHIHTHTYVGLENMYIFYFCRYIHICNSKHYTSARARARAHTHTHTHTFKHTHTHTHTSHVRSDLYVYPIQ